MNPILQKMGRSNPNPILGLLSGNTEVFFNSMLNSNPQFRQFVEMNKGKSPEQIAKENGIDINQVRNLIKKK